eukprot:83939-Hanusia_phi.AAC.11
MSSQDTTMKRRSKKMWDGCVTIRDGQQRRAWEGRGKAVTADRRIFVGEQKRRSRWIVEEKGES